MSLLWQVFVVRLLHRNYIQKSPPGFTFFTHLNTSCVINGACGKGGKLMILSDVNKTQWKLVSKIVLLNTSCPSYYKYRKQ